VASAGFDDTIAALATPPGRGATALVRISGPAAIDVLQRFCPTLVSIPAERRQTLLRIVHPASGSPLDHALVTVFRAPRSYSGEDTVEVSTHGGVLTARLVLDAAFTAGARPALPGEFTRRALLNGKMDLLQAEAVGDLIDGRSPATHTAALHQMERGLSRRIEELRSAILKIEALVAYSIDFPEEDEPPVPPATLQLATTDVLDRIELLLRTAPQGEMLRAGALVVFAGYPNSGKSSLFNALLGLERSIVTDVPGTTRDAIEADVVLDGFPFRLADTAGIRAADDPIEQLGIEVARRYLGAADVVLFCLDSTSEPAPDVRQFLDHLHECPVIIARTKADLTPSPTQLSPGEVPVSVVTGVGLSELKERLLDASFAGLRGSLEHAPVITSERQAGSLATASSELRSFLAALDIPVPMELASVHLRSAVAALEDLIGVVTTDDVLASVFSRFCVGK
jgi:tRNA modification GTPase